MKRSIHGEVKTLVYQAILLNGSLTVPELCTTTGLQPTQVYPLLAKLRNEGYLLTESAVEEIEGSKPAHRPNTIYRLTSNVDKQSILAKEIAPFLSLTSNLSSSPALRRVEQRIAATSDQLDHIETRWSAWLESTEVAALCDSVEQIGKTLKEIREDLDIAAYKIRGVEGHPLLEVMKGELERARKLSDRLNGLRRRLATVSAERSAEGRFTDLFHDLSSELVRLSEDEQIAKVSVRLQSEYLDTDNFLYRNMLSRVAAKIAFFESMKRTLTLPTPAPTPEFLFAESCLQFGTDAELAMSFVRCVLKRAHRDDLPTTYNLANLHLLSGQATEAKKLWTNLILSDTRNKRKELRTSLAGSKQLSVYDSTMVAYGAPSSMAFEDFKRLEQQLGVNGAVSIIGLTAVESFATKPYVIRPTLIDWLEPNCGFTISASISHREPELLAYGPVSDMVDFPGLPALRVATSLVRLGLDIGHSWDLAGSCKQDKGLLLLHVMKSASTLSGIDLPLGFELLAGANKTNTTKAA